MAVNSEHLKPISPESLDDKLHALRRRRKEFISHLHIPWEATKQANAFLEKVNHSDVTLSRYLEIRMQGLNNIEHKALLAQVGYQQQLRYSQDAHRHSGALENLVWHADLYQNYLNRCLEDWSIYTNPYNAVFLDYLQHYAFYNANEAPVQTDVAIKEIFQCRMRLQWACFSPMNYVQLMNQLRVFCDSDAEQQLAESLAYKNPLRHRHLLHNRRLSTKDMHKFKCIKRYFQSRRKGSIAKIDQAYLHDIVRFSRLFIEGGHDPIPHWDFELFQNTMDGLSWEEMNHRLVLRTLDLKAENNFVYDF